MSDDADRMLDEKPISFLNDTVDKEQCINT